MMTLSRLLPATFLALLAHAALAGAASADNALFTFGEMRQLQALPQVAASRALTAEEANLYQNMEFYSFTVFESLVAANNATQSLHGKPLFCAPADTFGFHEDADIAALQAVLVDALLDLVKAAGAEPDRYDDRPASEVLLMALRAAYPCGDQITAMR